MADPSEEEMLAVWHSVVPHERMPKWERYRMLLKALCLERRATQSLAEIVMRAVGRCHGCGGGGKFAGHPCGMCGPDRAALGVIMAGGAA